MLVLEKALERACRTPLRKLLRWSLWAGAETSLLFMISLAWERRRVNVFRASSGDSSFCSAFSLDCSAFSAFSAFSACSACSLAPSADADVSSAALASADSSFALAVSSAAASAGVRFRRLRPLRRC